MTYGELLRKTYEEIQGEPISETAALFADSVTGIKANEVVPPDREEEVRQMMHDTFHEVWSMPDEQVKQKALQAILKTKRN